MRYGYKLAAVLVQLGEHIRSICRPGSVLLVHARKRAHSDDMLGAEQGIACRGLIHVPSALGSTVVLTPLGEQFALRLLRARPNTELEDREGELWRGKRWGTYLQQALEYFLNYKKDIDYTISVSLEDGLPKAYSLDRDTGARPHVGMMAGGLVLGGFKRAVCPCARHTCAARDAQDWGARSACDRNASWPCSASQLRRPLALIGTRDCAPATRSALHPGTCMPVMRRAAQAEPRVAPLF